jgi:MMP 1-O-methyltransferase
METFPFEKIVGKIEKIDGWLWRNEMWVLYYYATLAVKNLKANEVLLEIGSWKGRSTSCMAFACKACRVGKVYAIDPFEKISSFRPIQKDILSSLRVARLELKKNITKNKLQFYVKRIELTSERAYLKYKNLRIRCIFIDGDHTYDAVQFDVSHWRNSLVNDGYLLLHDTLNHEGPRRVFCQLLLDPHYIYIRTTGDVAIFQKKKYLSPRNWLKKVYGYIAFWLFIRIYVPTNS